MTQLVSFLTTICIVAIFGESLVSAAPYAESNSVDDRVNSVLVDKLSWTCANNASCLYSLVNSVLNSYKRGEVVSFGIFDVEKLPPTKTPPASGVGRASGIVDFLTGNAIRIPIGPMVFSVQRAIDHGNFIEIALLKKSLNQGRRSGGGGGLGQRLGKHKEKKQFQMFIPMYLAATTFGWTLLAVKTVGFLTLKALAISKLAFVVAAMVVIKKLMDNASEKFMYPHYPEPQPFVMPYNMDYGLHAMQSPEISAGDMYPLHFAAAAAAANGMHPHHGLESLGAESKMHQVVDLQNGTQILSGLANQISHQQKIKRDDTWMGAARPFLYNYLPSRPTYNLRQ